MSLLVGRYRFIAPLGKGGMGTVWRAVDELLRQEVAVKEVRLPPDLDESTRAELSERTLREARAAARLRSHPSIVTVHDVVVENDRPWIIMELVQGRSLDKVIREDGPLSPSQVASIGVTLVDALSAAHGTGILHRDVKPANVLLTTDGRVVLTDFGIATVAGDTSLTRAGALTGSPGYIAPERLRGENEVQESDFWSLGATLYAAVEGHSPFSRDNQAAIMAAVLMQDPAPMRNAGPLASVLAQLLEKDPARRCPPAQAAAQLRAVAAGGTPAPMAAGYPPQLPQSVALPQTGPPDTGPQTSGRDTEPSSARPRRMWQPIALGGALAVALLGTSGYLIMHSASGAKAGGPAPNTHAPSSPPPALQADASPMYGENPTACSLLTVRQAGSLLGGKAKSHFESGGGCEWTRQNTGTFLQVTTIWQAKTDYAKTVFSAQRKTLQEAPLRTPGKATVREGPVIGDEAYSNTVKDTLVVTTYMTQVVFRKANVVVTVIYNGPRGGYRTTDQTAQLVLKAMGEPH